MTRSELRSAGDDASRRAAEALRDEALRLLVAADELAPSASADDRDQERTVLLAALARVHTAMDGLHEARERLLDLAVARGSGASELGRALGVTRQAAHRLHVQPRQRASR